MSPLSEITVVITRPREQAAELKLELEKLGAQVVLFPTIEIVAPESCADLDRAVQNLSDYDWLIFTSANAAEHFLRRFEFYNREFAELDLLRICAVGEATFERFRLAQVHVDLVPEKSSAAGIFDALGEYLGDPSEFKNLRFLLPRSSLASDFLPQKLREVGAFVKDVTAYQTILPIKPEIGKIKALLQVGAIDCLTFTSPSTFDNFVKLLGSDNLLLRPLFGNVALACLGETTAHAVREKNLLIDIVSNNANSAAFARAIADFYKQKKR